MANMFRYWHYSVTCCVQVFICGVFYGQPFEQPSDRCSLSCVPSFATWGISFVAVFTFVRWKQCIVSAFLTHALHVLSSGTSDYSRRDLRNLVLQVTSEKYLEKRIATSVGYTSLTSAALFCNLAQVQGRCVSCCWWMGHTASKQYLQPPGLVWCACRQDCTAKRHLSHSLRTACYIVGTPVELLEEANVLPRDHYISSL